MDDPNLQLESELMALRPRRPSILLRSRIARALDGPAGDATAAPASLTGTSQPSATSMAPWKRISWQLATAAVVAVAITVGVRSSRQPPPPASPPEAVASHPGEVREVLPPTFASTASNEAQDLFRPVRASNVLFDIQDEGLVLLDDATPARRVRARYVDTYTWKNPANGSSLRWSIPRDELRMVPTRFQ